jgi:zinc protease
MHRIWLPLVAGLGGVLVHSAYAAEPALPAGIQQVTSVEGITEYRLTNGLKVLLFPDASKQTVTVNMTYLVGSRQESYGETGMAHLLEHMVFKGSTKHPNIPQELTEHGARPNGSTSFDRTNYFETFAASEDNIRWALELESDRMVNSFIAKKDLDTEMTVVRNEFESGENEPSRVLEERVMSTAYLWHNYGHSPIGARTDVENVPIERLQNYYRTWYQPDNAVLLVAGKFDVTKTLNLVAQTFGVVPKPSRTLPTLYTAEPAQDGERSVALRRVGDAQYVIAAYHMPAGSHADAAALNLLSTVLGDAPSGRLYKSLVETQQAAEVSAGTYELHDPGVMLISAQVRKESSLDTARDTLLKTLDALAANPATREELERARAQELKQFELRLNNPDRVGLALSEYMGMGDWRLYFLSRDRTRALTLEDLKRVAANYLTPANRTVGLSYATAVATQVEVPATPDLVALLKDYKGDTAKSEGEAFDPSPANIEARTRRSRLPGGLQLALLPKKTRGSAVNLSLTLRFGDLQSLSGQRQAAAFAAAMLMRGTTLHTRQQLQDELDRLKARVNIGGGGGNVSASVETTRENLPAVLTLVAEVLRKPAFPQAEFDTLKQQRLAGLEEQAKEPTTLGQNALQRHISPYPANDIRHVSSVDESMAEIRATTLDSARRFYQQFYGAATGELAVVGDFDDKQLVALASKLFDGWRGRGRYERVASEYHDVAVINDTIQTPDKANAFMMAAINLKLRDDDADFPALVLGNYMLGGGFLNSRLAMRLRQKDGLSYSAGSQLQASSLDQAGVFVGYAIYAPQNAARLETGFREEIQRAQQDGFTAEELNAARSGWLQSRQVGRAQDGELTRTLATDLFIKRTLAWDAALEQKVAALTPAQVNAAVRKWLPLDKLSMIKAGDFTKQP